jgi:hypothetical protein
MSTAITIAPSNNAGAGGQDRTDNSLRVVIDGNAERDAGNQLRPPGDPHREPECNSRQCETQVKTAQTEQASQEMPVLQQYRGEQQKQDCRNCEVGKIMSLELFMPACKQYARQPGLNHQRQHLCEHYGQQLAERQSKGGWLHCHHGGS